MCGGDEHLTDLAKAGSLQAFDELVRRHRKSVAAATRSVLDRPEEVQDAVQEAFLIAFKNLNQLEDNSSFSAWVSAIARRRARRRLGQPSPVQLSDVDHLILRKSFEISRREWTGWEAIQLAELNLSSLEPDDRRLIEMSAAGISEHIAAKELGISVSACKSRLHRIRHKLRTKWESQK